VEVIMIRTSVNGEACGVSLDGIHTVGDVLAQLEVRVPPRDVIVGVRINGVACDDDPAASVRSLSVVGVSDIDLQTRSPEDFAAEARGRLDTYLAAIDGKFRSTVECLEGGRQADAFRSYRAGIEELGLLVNLCERLGCLGTPSLAADGSIARDLQNICDALETAQTRRDAGALRTAVAARLLPLLERWRATLGAATPRAQAS
jgi:hypothetical protein